MQAPCPPCESTRVGRGVRGPNLHLSAFHQGKAHLELPPPPPHRAGLRRQGVARQGEPPPQPRAAAVASCVTTHGYSQVCAWPACFYSLNCRRGVFLCNCTRDPTPEDRDLWGRAPFPSL